VCRLTGGVRPDRIVVGFGPGIAPAAHPAVPQRGIISTWTVKAARIAKPQARASRISFRVLIERRGYRPTGTARPHLAGEPEHVLDRAVGIPGTPPAFRPESVPPGNLRTS
jgi:hypothetical protein